MSEKYATIAIEKEQGVKTVSPSITYNHILEKDIEEIKFIPYFHRLHITNNYF